jgi:extracellular matrix regulatory protein B
MVLHIGKDEIVPLKDVMFILDYREAKNNDDTNRFLKKLGDGAHNIYIDKHNIKSVVVAKLQGAYFIFYSPISPGTLQKRAKS